MNDGEIELVNFKCDKCGKNLVQTLPAAHVLCRKCNHWVEQQSRGSKVYGTSIQKYSMSVVCK